LEGIVEIVFMTQDSPNSRNHLSFELFDERVKQFNGLMVVLTQVLSKLCSIIETLANGNL
jgi:hypothetical protein